MLRRTSDVLKDTNVACVRAPGPGGNGSSDLDLRHHDRRTVRARLFSPERDGSSTALIILFEGIS